MDKQYYVYIMANETNTVTYVGVTNDLIRRVYEHKNKLANGFSAKYNIGRLVYYENYPTIEGAILREKQIKAYKRKSKVELISKMNEHWLDLYSGIIE